MTKIWNEFAEILIWRLAMSLGNDARLMWIFDGATSEECAGEFWAAIAPHREDNVPWSSRKQWAVYHKQCRDLTPMEIAANERRLAEYLAAPLTEEEREQLST